MQNGGSRARSGLRKHAPTSSSSATTLATRGASYAGSPHIVSRDPVSRKGGGRSRCARRARGASRAVAREQRHRRSTRQPRQRRSTQLPGGPGSPYASRTGAIRLVPAGARCAGSARRCPRRRRRGDGRRLVAAPQGMSCRRLPMGVRRSRAQPLAPMVRHARLWEQAEGPRLPGAGMRKGLRIMAPLVPAVLRARQRPSACSRARRTFQLRRSDRDVGDDIRRLAQVAAVSVLGAGGGVAAAVVAALLLNVRYAPIGHHRRAVVPRAPVWRRLVEAQLVVDESWALAGGGTPRFDRRVMLGDRRRAVGRVGGRHCDRRAARGRRERSLGVRPRRSVRRPVLRLARRAAQRQPRGRRGSPRRCDRRRCSRRLRRRACRSSRRPPQCSSAGSAHERCVDHRARGRRRARWC